ncbi:CRE_HP_G0020940.mRNA.1.CDS.1 [Saccharomyces cerevisiae]|nr:CRE_HP_G0020940.mRNA.1.CDS.1 [Saccharomyces cerevisiae]CAI6460271.1 CRE_HP_G0020940.mRNA.1.CDS.1 [Saccharomyces cerevisiae]
MVNLILLVYRDSETDLLSILHPSTNGVLLINPQENPSKFIKLPKRLLVSQRIKSRVLKLIMVSVVTVL